MTDFLLAAAGFILFTVAVGLVRILGGPGDADRMMAAQLLGTGGIASSCSSHSRRMRAVSRTSLLDCPPRGLRLRRFCQQRRPRGGGRFQEANSAMSLAQDIFSIAAICAGAFSFSPARPDCCAFPTRCRRLHALTKADNLGLGLVVLGLLPRVGQPARRAEARRHLGAGPAVRGDDRAAHRARIAPRGTGRMTLLQALDLGLAVLVLAIAGWTIAAREPSPRSWAMSPMDCCSRSSGFASLRWMWR